MNGDYYEGEMINGRKHGYGKLVTGKQIYEGYFADDKFDGVGLVTCYEDVKRTRKLKHYFSAFVKGK